MIRIDGEGIVLRPFRGGETARLLEVEMGRTPGDVHRPLTREQIRRKVRGSGGWTPSPVGLVLAVETEGRLVGEIQARGGEWAALPPGVFELGVEIFDEADRHAGLGAAAIRAITRFLFGEEGAIRVQLSTAMDNAAMRRLAEGLGFGFEGTLRGFMPSPGGPQDHAMYAMTRDDHERVAWV